MNYSLKNRVISMVLAVIMLIGYIPTNVFATETEETTTPETVTVTFHVNGGIGEYEDQVVTLGDKVAKPEADPTHETATFAYWTADLESNGEWNFEENIVTEDMTLYASWIVDAEDPDAEDPDAEDPDAEDPDAEDPDAEDPDVEDPDAEDPDAEEPEAEEPEAEEPEAEDPDTEEPGDEENVAQIDDKPDVPGATANGLPNDMAMVSDKKSTLAPGIVERQIVAYDKNGDRVLLYVATADMAVDTVEVYANYQNNVAPPWGMQKTTDQAAAFEANHEGKNVVVAINASYFNTSTGQPTGAFAMEGNLINNDASGNGYSFFAIMKDGSAMIGSKGEYTAYKDQIQEAIGGYIHLVKDGQICSGLNNVDKYPRQTIGITAEGKVIIMTADCLAAVNSAGLTVQEQAEVMLSLGCVEAVHLDGGGSGTYCSKPAGTDKLVVTSNPSNGTERAVSNTLILVSTAKADGEFDSAILTAEHKYVTPGSAVKITAVGLDASNGPAEIPEDAVWQLDDSTLGTVENDVFVSNGTVGTAEVQMVYDGEVVGSVIIEVVVPDTLSFGEQTSVIIPYGKSADLPVKATYNGKEVFFNAEDVSVVLADEGACAVKGLTITAPAADSGITSTSVMVSLKADATVAASVELVFGKGSEVVFDFEAGSDSANAGKWILRTHETTNADYGERGEIYIVDKNNGMVHDGEQALAFNADFSQGTMDGSNTAGYIAMSLSWGGEAIDIKGAKSVGFWLYVPEDAMTTEITLNTVYYDAKGVAQRRTVDCFDDNGEMIYTPYWGTKMEGSGWHYVKADLSKFADNLLIKDEPGLSGAYKRNFFIKIFCVSGQDSVDFQGYHGDLTYYIDNVTVDYSDAVEDRELPVFSAAYANAGALDNVALTYGKTVSVASGEVSFAANVADNTKKTNYTGLNAATAKVFVDGNAIGAAYANGMISSADVTLPDGYHTVRFEIADNNGNVGYITRTFNVNAGSDKATVNLVAKDPSLDRLLSGSIYWVDLVSEDIANIKSIETILNLNSIHNWELEHMAVSRGFDVSYAASPVQTAENNVRLTITRNGDKIDPDSNVIVSIPIRVWESLVHENPKHTTKTPASQWSSGRIDPMGLILKVDKGLVTFVDNTQSYFSDCIEVDHEAYTAYYAMDKDYHASRTYHVHTAEAMTDMAATCTEDGYTGRIYCAGCDSVVAWGTAVDATGHSYNFVDGVLKCACGERFSGEYTDGKIYADGVVISDGWVGEAYYIGGVKLTYVHKVPAPDASGEFYYDFGEEGVCAGQVKYTGLFLDATANVYRYSKLGVLAGGWQLIDGEWYLFDDNTMAAVVGTYNHTSDIVYEFAENGRIIKGCWAKTLNGTRYYYGPGSYQSGWQTIDGKDYYFENYFRVEGGYQLIADESKEFRWAYFEEDGSCDRNRQIPDGFYTDRKGYGYSKDGKALLGIQMIDGIRYGFSYLGYAKTGTYGGYLFGDDYKGYTGILEKNGKRYYYENGRGVMAGLVEIDGDYYFAKDGDGLLVTDQTYYVWKGNGILPESERTFGPDGKMYNGIVEIDGGYYYYNMGRAEMAGLIEIDGDYYFAKDSNGQLITDQTYYIWKTNGLLPESERTFGPDGKMYNGIVEIDGGYYYYNMGRPQMAGLILVDGHYYFAKDGKGTIVTNRVYYNWMGNGLLPAGDYSFGADGKMIDGIVEIDGSLHYYVNGKPCMAGLFEFNGDYYFAKDANGTIITDRTYYVWKGNGIIPESERTFGADGKMLDGIVERDGNYYYYNMGRPQMAGLIEIDGAYYFAKDGNGKLITNQTYYVWKGNGIIPESDREFGADGKMLDGIVERDGKYYYYNMGRPQMAGLIEIDGAYYFAKDGKGLLVADQTYYVWKGNGLLPESERTFGVDGKMLDGFITKNDGIYYYEDGRLGAVGLHYIDGYYYFVGSDGKLVTNRTYYVWKTNGLCVAGNYKFDAQGRIVL